MSTVLFLVPARSGSKGIPDKNLRAVAGLPLVGWAVLTARRAASRLPDVQCRVVCSTDGAAIAAVAREHGAETPFLRPAELATDEASSVDVALQALDALERTGASFDALCLVQPTSPLTLPEDLAQAVRLFLASGGPGVASVTRGHPTSWSYGLREGRLGAPFEASDGRRQDLPAVASLNGAAFVVSPRHLRSSRQFVIPGETLAYEMPSERSIDVDAEGDLALAAALLGGRTQPRLLLGSPGGDPDRCLIIAEAGVNHDGEVTAAHVLVEAAAQAGADVVKFQTWNTDLLCAPGAPGAEYQRQATGFVDQHALLRRLELPQDAWRELKQHAESLGLIFLSTPDDMESARLLCELGMAAIKVGSGELTNLPFLRQLASLGPPLLLSTGMSTMAEVAGAVGAVEASGSVIALLHCVSAYPAPPEDLNLECLVTLRHAFSLPVGLSDHSLGPVAPVMGVAFGMSLLEKHLTLDRSRKGPDHSASADPQEFATLVKMVRTAEQMRGDGRKRPMPSEKETRQVVRRTLLYGRSRVAGERLPQGELIALRAGGVGLPPAMASVLEGRVLRRAVKAGEPVAEADLD